MQPTVYWIETPTTGRLATMAHPQGEPGLETQLNALKTMGVQVLVPLITEHEASQLRLEQEAEKAAAIGIEPLPFPISDFGIPPLDATTSAFVADLAARVRDGQSVVVHCWMGIGRSSLIAASVLCMLGHTPEDAFARISAARGRDVPDTITQRQWVERFAELWPRLT